MMFFPLHVFREIAKQTNRRFEQKPPKSEKYRKRWRLGTTVTDWVRFMGIILLATLCKQQHFEMYWSLDSLCKVNPYERSGISYHKFRLMKRYMHCMDINDPVVKPKRGEDNHDPLAQIRYVYESVRHQFHVYVKPGQDLAIDELMVACKLRTHLQQCIKGKPTPNGIKIFALAGKGGLVHDFIIDDGMVFARRPWALNGEAGILEFVERMNLAPLTRLYFDRWFVSVRIIRFLAKVWRIKSVGPIQANRGHLPVHKVPNNAPEHYPPSIRILGYKKKCRGYYNALVADEALVVASGWKDSKQCFFVSAGFPLRGGTVVRNVYPKNLPPEHPGRYKRMETSIQAPPGVQLHGHG